MKEYYYLGNFWRPYRIIYFIETSRNICAFFSSSSYCHLVSLLCFSLRQYDGWIDCGESGAIRLVWHVVYFIPCVGISWGATNDNATGFVRLWIYDRQSTCSMNAYSMGSHYVLMFCTFNILTVINIMRCTITALAPFISVDQL